jgi:hypothetical protein
MGLVVWAAAAAVARVEGQASGAVWEAESAPALAPACTLGPARPVGAPLRRLDTRQSPGAAPWWLMAGARRCRVGTPTVWVVY